jgi:hypothetical protein
MSYDSNVASSPEKYGLTVFGEAEANGGYSFDTFIVWRDKAGNYLWAADSGCSCPVPFDDFDLSNLPVGSARDALTDLIAWADDPDSDYRYSGEVGPTQRRQVASALIEKLTAEATA